MILSVSDLTEVVITDPRRPTLRLNPPIREERKKTIIGNKMVDYIGTEPTQEQIDAFVAGPNVLDQTDLDNLAKSIRALALVQRDWCNFLKAEVRGLALLLVNKGLITNAEATALRAYDGSLPNDAMSIQDLKDLFAEKYTSLP